MSGLETGALGAIGLLVAEMTANNNWASMLRELKRVPLWSPDRKA